MFFEERKYTGNVNVCLRGKCKGKIMKMLYEERKMGGRQPVRQERDV